MQIYSRLIMQLHENKCAVMFIFYYSFKMIGVAAGVWIIHIAPLLWPYIDICVTYTVA